MLGERFVNEKEIGLLKGKRVFSMSLKSDYANGFWTENLETMLLDLKHTIEHNNTHQSPSEYIISQDNACVCEHT